MSAWIDITTPIDERMTCWPGRTPPRPEWTKRLEKGDHCNVSVWSLNAHTGTHVDAPLHFIAGGAEIDQIPLNTLAGRCRVIDVNDPDLARHAGVQRLLIRSAGPVQPHGPLITHDAARRLLDAGLILLGTDRLSVDPSDGSSYALHHLILGRGCVIVEGLQLGPIAPGEYEVAILPLLLAGAEAAPARAAIRTRAADQP